MSSFNPKTVHPFPARMAPEIVFSRLSRKSSPLTVLDPMAGSGTTLAAAHHLGHDAIGFDSDPLAVIIARAWCCQLNEKRFRDAATGVMQAAEKRVFSQRGAVFSPVSADEETRQFIDYWFDADARRELLALAGEIASVTPEGLRATLWCAFSRMIITKEAGVSLAMDVSHSRPHRVYKVAPRSPLAEFPKAVDIVAKRKFYCKSKSVASEPQIDNADARHLPLSNCSVDIVITSPPYLNAIDYLRGHRLALVWMGHTLSALRQLRATNVGTECGIDIAYAGQPQRLKEALDRVTNISKIPSRQKRMISKYVQDMDAAIEEVARVLKVGGEAVYVVGDCNVKGIFVANSGIVRFLASQHQLAWKSTRRRTIAANKRYLPPPCSEKAGKQLRTRMGDEVILSFRKCG